MWTRNIIFNVLEDTFNKLKQIKLILIVYFLKYNESKTSPQCIINIQIHQIFYSCPLKILYGNYTFGPCEFSLGTSHVFKNHWHLRLLRDKYAEKKIPGRTVAQTLGITWKPCVLSYTCSSRCCFYDLNYHIEVKTDQTTRTLKGQREKMPCEASWMHPAHSLKMMDCGDFRERVAAMYSFVWWQGQGHSCQVGPESQSPTTSKHILVVTKSLSSGLLDRQGFCAHSHMNTHIWTEWISDDNISTRYSRGTSLLLDFCFLPPSIHSFTGGRTWPQPASPS